MSKDYLDEIAELQTQLSEFSDDYHENEDDEDRLKEFKDALLEIMRETVNVVDDAQRNQAASLPDLVKAAESLLNEAVTLAYEGSGEGSNLFTTLQSFAENEERPKIERAREAEGVFSHKMVKIGLQLAKMMRGFGGMNRPPPRAPAPWKTVVRLHPLSTRCARFSNITPESAPSGEKPQALSVFQARAEVSMGEVGQPNTLFASASGKCFIMPTQGGWKGRSPYLYTFYSDDQPTDYLEGKSGLLGLSDIVSQGAVDDESGLLFVGDSNRIKSYSWWDSEKNATIPKLVPTHTLNSNGFRAAIGILPNGRVARGGDGKIGVWNLNDLPTHQTTEGLIGGNIAEKDEDLDTWRDDPKNIERSSGSLPHATITLRDEPFNVSLWHNHPSTKGSILATSESEENNQWYCRALDLEDGKCTARFLGHAGDINQISTSKGDPNVFVTAADDALARLYDVRQSLPVLTIQAGNSLQNCISAIVCHLDGIPYIFASEEEAEAITTWDVRARAAVYDLATGNNRVVKGGMFWNDSRNELYAATHCSSIDRNGRQSGYEPAQIPVDRDDVDSDGDSNMGDEDEDDEVEYQDTDQCWPKNAYHNETYFGHTFDSGGHRIYRYAFKSEPNPEIVPPDGGAMAQGGGW